MVKNPLLDDNKYQLENLSEILSRVQFFFFFVNTRLKHTFTHALEHILLYVFNAFQTHALVHIFNKRMNKAFCS